MFVNIGKEEAWLSMHLVGLKKSSKCNKRVFLELEADWQPSIAKRGLPKGG